MWSFLFSRKLISVNDLKISIQKKDKANTISQIKKLAETHSQNEFIDYFFKLLSDDNPKGIEIIEFFNECQIKISAKDPDGNTPLMIAVKNRNLKAIELLLKKLEFKIFIAHFFVENFGDPSSINETNRQGDSAFIIACSYGYSEIVEILLNHKANPRIQNNRGNTGLMMCVLSGDFSTLKVITYCDFKINVNAKNQNGQTALMLAAARNDYNQVIWLVDRLEASISIMDINGRTAIEYTSNHDIKNYLLNKFKKICEPFLEFYKLKNSYSENMSSVSSSSKKFSRIV